MAEVRAENRYRVIKRLATGGMAEVFHAESISLAGFTKPVAIKRVLPQIAQNEKFTKMFLDEARLCARLNHRNIVQVFDIGRADDSYFIVMEYVDGLTARALMDHLRKRGETIPVPVAMHIAIETCNGLDYAHRLKDAAGVRLGIVHRDISPANILLSKAGGVKIVDFGLAKTVSQIEKTDPGVLKGKFGYLAPETAAGEEADGQADNFGVAIVLWEMLAGRRLFTGETDWDIVQAVQACVVPPLRAEHPEVPAALDELLRVALAKDKSERFPTAGAMGRALTELLFKEQLPVTAEDLAILVHDALNVRYTLRTSDTGSRPAPVPKDLEETLLRFEPISATATVPPPPPTNAGEASESLPVAAVERPPSTAVPGRTASSGRWKIAALVVAAVVGTAGAWFTRTLAGSGARTRAAGNSAVAPGGSSAVDPAPSGAQARPAEPPSQPATPPPSTPPPTAPNATPPPTAPNATPPPTALPAAVRIASDADAAVPDIPSVRTRFALTAAIQRSVAACEAADNETHRRHARYFVTYDGPTGNVVELTNRVPYFAARPIGACLDRAVRSVSAAPFRRDRWSTDYTFEVQ